eukprot:scaffold180581_cov25-Tisochrysis_lutea.AAC.1
MRTGKCAARSRVSTRMSSGSCGTRAYAVFLVFSTFEILEAFTGDGRVHEQTHNLMRFRPKLERGRGIAHTCAKQKLFLGRGAWLLLFMLRSALEEGNGGRTRYGPASGGALPVSAAKILLRRVLDQRAFIECRRVQHRLPEGQLTSLGPTRECGCESC